MAGKAVAGIPVAAAAVVLVMLAVGSASPPSGYLTLAWTRYAANPVLVNGSAGSWDSMHVIGGPVLFLDGTYRIWYVGTADNLYSATGTATSTDGIHWTKDPSNPIIPGDAGSQVLYEDGTYKMWYANITSTAYTVPWPVDYAVSQDGIHWTSGAEGSVLNVTPGAWDSYTLMPGPVIHDASGYRMWYSATADQMVWRVGLATSPDGIHWTKYAGNPIIVPPFAGSWDDFRVHPSSILAEDGQLVMWYVSDDTNLTQRIGVAISADGIDWTPSPTPALDIGTNGSWDQGSLSRLSVVQQGSLLRMWYTGHDTRDGFMGHWQVGLATATLNDTSLLPPTESPPSSPPPSSSPPAGPPPSSPGGAGSPPQSTPSSPVPVALGIGIVAAGTLGGAGFGAAIAVVVRRPRP